VSGRVALVTGAAGGIGRGIAERLAADGAAVAIADVDPAGAELAAELRAAGHDAVFGAVDVGDADQVEAFVARVDGELGPIDVLVNNAAVSLGQSFLQTSWDTWARTLRVNLSGAFLCGQAVARRMAARGTGGRIVNIGSTNSFTAERGHASYVASKGGIAMLTRAMAVDLAPDGILVNAVAPGPVRTEATAPVFDSEDYRRALAHGVPLARAGRPAEIAGIVAFLVSDDASYMTGSFVVADGGWLSYLRTD
jgi:NAD(P)-dependent dehydrogenase (short-subunit alcohol dehydrogenase family)